MLRFSIFLILLCVTPIFAYDYSHCTKYFNAASTPVGSSNAVSIEYNKKQLHLMYSPSTPKNAKIIKADPFIGLYLIDAPHTKQSYNLLPLDARTLNDKNLVFISRNKPQKGYITKRQNGFVNYASFSAPVQQNSVLGNICYQIYGIGTGGNHFIEKKYIDRFLNQKTPYYGDLGIRFLPNPQKAIVDVIDPFYPNNPFRIQDEILSINGTKIQSSYDLEWIMSNLKKDSIAKVLIKREGKTLTLQAKVAQRRGGFLLNETFLERFGIYIDDEMVIQKINLAIAGRFSILREGDKILWINKQPIITPTTQSVSQRFNRLKFLLSQTPYDDTYDGKMQLLIVRDQLEIFVKL